MLRSKATDLEQVLKTFDKRTEQLTELAVDLSYLRTQKEREDGQLTKITERLFRLQNVDEIHIEIDVLSQTQHGV